MRVALLALLSAAVSRARRFSPALVAALWILGFPAALSAQTLTYVGPQTPITYNGILAPVSAAVDTAGDLYIADAGLTSIVKITPGGVQSTIGTGLATPINVAVDLSANVYVVDSGTSQVVEIAPNGTQTVVPFNGLVQPFGIVVSSSGAIYVSDGENAVVYKLLSGTQTTVGSGFNIPQGLALDSAGNLYVADAGAGEVFKITPGGVQTQVGSNFINPSAVAVDARGVVYVADSHFPQGDIDEIEGNTTVGFGFGPATGVAINSSGGLFAVGNDSGVVAGINLGARDFGSANVCPQNATTPAPCSQSLTLNFVVPATQISISFSGARAVAEGSPNLDFTTTANTCTGTSSGNTSCSITIQFRPVAPGVRAGSIDVLGSLNGGPPGSLFTLPIHGVGLAPLAAFDSQLISTPTFPFLSEVFLGGVTPDSAGNLYIADANNCVIQKWTASTNVLSTIAGTGTCASAASSNGVPATSATFLSIWKPAVDGRGNVYFSDSSEYVIWKLDALTGDVSVFAGTFQSRGQSGDGGLAANALLNAPSVIAIDAAGDLYVDDVDANTVRRIDSVTSVVTTIAGDYPAGQSGSSGDGGQATSALLYFPTSVALDTGGNLFIDDNGNNVIRKVNLGTGIISTVAGQLPPATYGYAGDGGAATAALLNNPDAITVDVAGNLYIADSANMVVRKVSAATGNISTIAGVFTAPFNGSNGTDTGDGGPANLATFSYLLDISVDSLGNLYLVDPFFSVIRKVTAASGKLAFGSSPVGTASPAQTVRINNNGNSPLSFASLAYSANFAADEGSTTCSTSSPLGAGDTCSAAAIFLPIVAGSLAGTATFTDNDPTLTQAISLSGTGTAAVPVPAKLALAGVPSMLASGANLGILDVSVETAGGVVFTSSNASITLTISGPGGFSYTATVAAVGGVAVFPLNSLVLSTPGSYILTVVSTGLASASGALTVSSPVPPSGPTATKLAFGAVSSAVVFGGNLGTVVVLVETGSGNTVNTSDASVTLTIAGPDGFAYTASKNAVVGRAAFDLATVVFTATGKYSITAYSTGLTSATAAFTVAQAGPVAAELAFLTPPKTIVQGSNLGKFPVSVEDSSGTLVTGSAAGITLTITSAGGYSKILTAVASSGVALFDLSADPFALAGSYTITATSSGLASATASFAVEEGFVVSAGSGSGGTGPSQTVAPGNPAVYRLTLAPEGSSYTLPITLTATGLPPGATYTFSPDVVTPGPSAATSTFTIQTAKNTAAVPWPQRRSTGMREFALALLLVPLTIFRRGRKIALGLPRLGLAMALLLLGTAIGLSGCAAGGLYSVAPAQYVVTVVGTSGSVVHTTTVVLIEQ